MAWPLSFCSSSVLASVILKCVDEEKIVFRVVRPFALNLEKVYLKVKFSFCNQLQNYAKK